MGDIGMLKEVLLAWLLCGKRGVFGDAVGLLGIVGLGDYRKEGGEETNKSTAKQTICMTCRWGDADYRVNAVNSWELIKY